ncbi:ribosomal protein RSM22 (predicted rRNA methylase) [Inquilinus ginsengisoli]|uniref:Ribosomal protein RSM22 (Predicted rRNA methylase) n=1 Tax=Inquilinus ginsengisoli TaxID=363840 RepID=A0ABU1JNZ9_9PROT|nr:small ribosomal subunit Rsm22 family protein [Inquilinus ginsengisoli]MDR6289275.1 ribosomal protein RSM22 (predicted rRNA methylase) [Inquilinus ginsengisoli]
MELPAALRSAVDRALEGVALVDLSAASARLSQRYRAELRDGRFHVDGDLAARAYLATRLPATYAAIRACLDAVADLRPDFAPASLLDAGAGPGTGFWAAAEAWPDLAGATLLEGSAAFRDWGARLAEGSALPPADWRAADLARALPDLPAHDLVILSYVLDELAPDRRAALVDGLWAATADVLLLVEPGTPAGWRRILDARSRLIASGGHVVAPCPHDRACPLVEPDWCHFAQRVARSRIHRQAKGGEVPWEDEKFAYVAVSRRPGAPIAGRVITPPRGAGSRIDLRLCGPDGVVERTVTKRDGALLKTARRLKWGDALGPGA